MYETTVKDFIDLTSIKQRIKKNDTCLERRPSGIKK